MRIRRRQVLAAGIGVVLVGACAPEVREARFPALALPALEGKGNTFAALEGALLVNYWATWCGPCREEMPSLERLSRRLPAGVRVVAVTVDEDLNLAREWLRKLGISFPVFADPGMRASRGELDLKALPETFLVASDRRILQRTSGARDWDAEESRAAIAQALGGSAAYRTGGTALR